MLMKMIKKLRFRFVAITMIIVTVMLLVIFGLVLSLTHRRIYSDSVKMLSQLSGVPLGMNQNRRPERRERNKETSVQLPFFRVEVDSNGEIIATDGDFYDLTDEDSLQTLVNDVLARSERIGDLSDYNLRYFRSMVSNIKMMDPGAQPAPGESPQVDKDGKALEAGSSEPTPPEVNGNRDNIPQGDDNSMSMGQPQKDSGMEGPGQSPEGSGQNITGNEVPNPEIINKEDYDSGAIGKENWDGKRNRIIVFADISSEVATMRNLIRNCMLIALLSFLIFLVIAIFFARWAVKPVEDAWIQQRQFVSDASHELKTPLTVILTDAEMLKSRNLDDAQKKQFAENIYTMSHQMRGLVDSLLQLARVDNGAIQKQPHEIIDLSKMISDEILTFEVLFFEKGLMLTENIQEGISIKGSRQHIKQAIEILLDNAQKYSDPKGTVTVSLEKSGSHKCLISVADPGEQISEEDIKNIFKRFYRIDEARAMNHSYGLGLSIAQNIVTEHKGRIWAESKDGINTFKIELPTM